MNLENIEKEFVDKNGELLSLHKTSYSDFLESELTELFKEVKEIKALSRYLITHSKCTFSKDSLHNKLWNERKVKLCEKIGITIFE